MQVSQNPSIAIGGLGGSGTRVVARILEQGGISMGSYLNDSHDNLLFTLLFKDPYWHKIAKTPEYYFRLGLFEKIMQGWSLGQYEQSYLDRVRKVNKYFDHELDLKKGSVITSEWGWKEPNSHIYAKQILEYFSELKFIYVLRDGHYMAFSKNQQQLRNWGRMILSRDQSKSRNVRLKQLQFWMSSTKRLLRLKQSDLSSRIYICNYNKLIDDPKKEISSLFKFADLDIQKVSSIVDVIEQSMNRGNGRKFELRNVQENLISQIDRYNDLNGPLNNIKS